MIRLSAPLLGLFVLWGESTHAEPPVQLPPVVREGAPEPAHALRSGQADIRLQLRALPGLALRSSGGLGAYTEASLRGSSGRQLSLQLNGVPLLTPGGEALNLALLPTTALGSARVATDADAGLVGGIALYTARTPENELGLGWGTYGAIGAQGSYARYRYRWDLAWRQADNDYPIRNPGSAFDPSDPDRRREQPRQNAQTRQLSLLHSTPQSLLLLVDNSERIPNQRNSGNNRAQLRTRLIQTGGRGLGLSGSHWWLGAIEERFTDRDAQLALAAADNRGQTLGGGWSSGDWQPVWAGGVQFTHFRNDDALRPDAELAATRLTADLEYRPQAEAGSAMAQWQLRAGASLQGEWQRQARSQVELLPQLDLRWRGDSAWQPSLALRYRERTPTFFEKFGNRGLFQGNPDLAPEKALSLTLGLLPPGPLSPQISTYVRWLEDAITPQYNARGVGRSSNTGRAEILGLSLHQDWQIHPRLALNARLDALRARDTGASPTRGRQLPGRARWIADLGADWTLGAWAIAYAFHYESGAFYDSPNLLPAPVVREHDLSLHWTGASTRLALALRNLSDNRHARFNGFPEPGRTAWLNLTLYFSKEP